LKNQSLNFGKSLIKMPIHSGYQSANSYTGEAGYYFYQWGSHGHKYSYDPNDPASEQAAYAAAGRQARAAHAHGYKG
jgi:hypothetical protein